MNAAPAQKPRRSVVPVTLTPLFDNSLAFSMTSSHVSAGFRPGFVEDVGAVVLHLAIAVRRQPIELAALRGWLVAIEVEDVLGNVREDVLFELRILVEIGLKVLERAFGDELRRIIVVVEDHIVAIGLRRHSDSGLRQHVANWFGENLNVDIGKFFLEHGQYALLRKFPALACRSPRHDGGRSTWAERSRTESGRSGKRPNDRPRPILFSADRRDSGAPNNPRGRRSLTSNHNSTSVLRSSETTTT